MSRNLFRAAFAAAMLLTSGTIRAQEAGITVGSTAPGAAVVTLDGKAIDLAQYIGKKPVVLEFWATWCPLCKQLEPSAQAAREQYGDRVTFISVGVSNQQTPAAQKKFADERHIGGLFVFDRDDKAVAAYKAPHTSYLVVIDQGGKVVYTGVGGDQNVGAAVAKALPTSHGMMGPGMGRGGK